MNTPESAQKPADAISIPEWAPELEVSESALDRFIYSNEPAGADEDLFRKELAEVVAEVERLTAERVLALAADTDGEAKRIIEGIVGLLSNCSVESGICCCGDNMEDHASPMSCGHPPVDSGAHYGEKLFKDAVAWLEAQDRRDA